MAKAGRPTKKEAQARELADKIAASTKFKLKFTDDGELIISPASRKQRLICYYKPFDESPLRFLETIQDPNVTKNNADQDSRVALIVTDVQKTLGGVNRPDPETGAKAQDDLVMEGAENSARV